MIDDFDIQITPEEFEESLIIYFYDEVEGQPH